MKNIPILLSSILLLNSCGERRSTVFKKQKGKSTINIESLDLSTGEIKSLLDFRSYRPKSLFRVVCDFNLEPLEEFQVQLTDTIQLGAFATEVLVFQADKLILHPVLAEKEKIRYTLSCELEYDKGVEFIRFQSELFIRPGSDFQYR